MKEQKMPLYNAQIEQEKLKDYNAGINKEKHPEEISKKLCNLIKEIYRHENYLEKLIHFYFYQHLIINIFFVKIFVEN